MRVLRSPMPGRAMVLLLSMIATLFFAASAFGQAQAAAADLTGTVTDQNGAVVAGATVTAKLAGGGLTRTVTTDSDGNYQMIALPPGTYEVNASAATFKKSVLSDVKLTIGQSAQLAIKLEVGEASAVVNVTGEDVQLVETTKTNVSNTIDQTRIQNLPINERSATGFALTLSTVGRDNGRPIGPAPTSGLNIGGQRGRSTLVQVDGADFTDNSINAARSTVSQEAVQEYQVTTNSYMPEFGRATGGIVNIVTKRGASDFHGDVFGYIRHKSIQSRNAFAPIIDNDPSKKPPYTRTQYGFTLGGPMVPNKTFFFLSFEGRRRQESGFFTGDITGGGNSSVTIPVIPGLNPFARTFNNLTSNQVAYINTMLGLGTPTSICTARAYAFFVGVGAATALNGASTQASPNDGSGCPAITPILPGVIGQRFLLTGAPVPLTRNADGQLIAFRPLAQLNRVFPISDNTKYSSLRIDHTISQNNQWMMRFGYNPSRISGIQDESQNQTLGQNDYSRTGIQQLEDFSFGTSLTTIMGQNTLNELYYNFGRRVAKFDSQVPSVAIQIAGTGFIGANPFSPVDRVEKRHQIRDNFTIASGSHTFKFGGDLNWISGKAKFELNFPALFNFSQQSASGFITGCDSVTLPVAQRCPAFTAVQAYGLGYPGVFIQGFGNPFSTIANKPVAVYGQDTWRISRTFTLNYGVRYDYEFTEQFAPSAFQDPLTGITLSVADLQTAQNALNITQGYPRDKNNIAPRLGFAWDIGGNAKTVIRGAIGRFFDHPALASSFISNIGDGSQQQQSTLLPLSPSPLSLLNAFQVFQGTIISCNFPGAIPGVNCTPGLAGSAQYLAGQMRFNPQTFTGFGPILPFTLHVTKDYKYPDAMQANFTIERALGKDMLLTASYIGVQAHHLNHPQDINSPNTDAMRENFRRFAVNNPAFPGCTSATPNAPSCFPTSGSAASFFYLGAAQVALSTNNALYTTLTPGTPIGLVNINNTTGQHFVNPIAANYFRPLGPNYFFASAISGGAVTKAIYDALIAGSVRTPGPISPFGDVSAQLSDGNSFYHAMNLEMKKRFSNNMQFLASYTWSHSIDDSSDLQTLLKPQNNRDFRAERSDSLFDQRHRFVFSGVIGAPAGWRSGGSFHRFLHGFTLSPIVEFSSGRPFNILAIGDSNGDQQSTNERPSVLPSGVLCATGVDPGCLQGIFPADGSLGRNMGITHNYFSVDARLTRRVNLGERVRMDIIAEGFNLFNRFNEAAGNPFYQVVNAHNERAGSGKYYSQPTSSFDPRQFQLGLRFAF